MNKEDISEKDKLARIRYELNYQGHLKPLAIHILDEALKKRKIVKVEIVRYQIG